MKSTLAFLTLFFILAFSVEGKAQSGTNYIKVQDAITGLIWLGVTLMLVFVAIIVYRFNTFKQVLESNNQIEKTSALLLFNNVGSNQIETFLKIKSKSCCSKCKNNNISCNKIKQAHKKDERIT
jgi:hypothetical protein